MGVDISGGLLIGTHASKVCVDIDVLMENDDIVKYAEYYDAPIEHCHIGFKINKVLVSEMNVEWFGYINELAKRFENLTGAKAELIGCQHIWQKGINMHTQSCFKISGKARRNLKKELGRVNSYIRNFWHYHQLDVDMCSFYSYKSDSYPMSNEKAESYFQELIVKANTLTAQLNEINNL